MSQVHSHAAGWVEQVARSAGLRCRAVAEAISPRLARRRSPRSWTTSWWISPTRSSGDAARPHRHRQEPRSADALPPQHGPPAGGGGDRALPRPPSAASARPPTKASSTTSSCRGRSCPRTSRPSRQKMRELAQADFRLRAADVAARGSEAVLRRARRAAEGAADRREDRRPVRGVRATPSRTKRPSWTSASARTCRRAAG